VNGNVTLQKKGGSVMFKFSDILGTLMQSGGSGTAARRMQHALGAGGRKSGGSLADLLGRGSGMGDALAGLTGGARGGGIGDMLQGVLGDAGKALGGGNKLALGGLGALAGSLLGGGGGSVKGAIGGGVMAMLGALAFSALKGTGDSDSQEMPVGLQQPENPQQEAELEQGAELVLKAMLNAAKADGEIDAAEIQRILGKLEEAGMDSDARDFVINEMNKPMDLGTIVDAAKGRPQLAAQIYAASLLAIEVDTPAERQYMQQLADGLYLTPEITAHIERTVGL
jgi:uncharacterized membrane protein YebE (DUF533 family)